VTLMADYFGVGIGLERHMSPDAQQLAVSFSPVNPTPRDQLNAPF
jgi:hypothetical protein